MAWNSKAYNLTNVQPLQEKKVPLGAPAAVVNRTGYGTVDRGYRDGWDSERAYSEAMSKVTWVYRAIDAIASNQAKLPMILRSDNRRDGAIVTEHPLLSLVNNQSNMGEDAYNFRYRLSTQLALSTRGVFIEVIRDGSGSPLALQLLPPQSTAPVPDPKKFVKYFEVKLTDHKTVKLPAEDVIWIRRAHPLDPYLSMTPMEAAGVAIELENLAKIYNRNFLINDGRPGGLLVLRSEIADEDKEELRSRFRGNIGRTGSVGVISSDDGADFVDTAASPRDAAYTQMRTITKEEILAAFGVPESIIGNSSGRTFSNAMEEGKVFWMETMSPHLDLIARSFDKIDDSFFIDFDVTNVPILILSKQERERHYLNEFQTGLISTNEYREASGRKKVESDLADSLLSNPNQTPIANTEKPMNEETEVESGVPLDVQAQNAQQEQVTEFSPEEGAFVEAGTVEGTMNIEAPASAVPSELEGDEPEGRKSDPFQPV